MQYFCLRFVVHLFGFYMELITQLEYIMSIPRSDALFVYNYLFFINLDWFRFSLWMRNYYKIKSLSQHNDEFVRQFNYSLLIFIAIHPLIPILLNEDNLNLVLWPSSLRKQISIANYCFVYYSYFHKPFTRSRKE